MALNIAKEVREMHQRTVRELRKQYADVFGEATNASNKDWLIKRIAWRMQSNVEGDISKRARNRALEIANDADLRMAVRFEKLLAEGVVPDYAELARLGHVTRARLTQIMNLRLLAPDIQEAILFADEIFSGRDPISIRQLQPIALTADWKKQRRLWKRLSSESGPNVSTSPE